LSHIGLGTKFQVKKKQSLKFSIEFKVDLKIFIKYFKKNINFSKNIIIRSIQRVN